MPQSKTMLCNKRSRSNEKPEHCSWRVEEQKPSAVKNKLVFKIEKGMKQREIFSRVLTGRELFRGADISLLQGVAAEEATPSPPPCTWPGLGAALARGQLKL